MGSRLILGSMIVRGKKRRGADRYRGVRGHSHGLHGRVVRRLSAGKNIAMNRFFAYFKDQMLFSPSRAHRIIRYCVIFLIAFELLNFGRALSFTVEFTWLGLVLTSLFSYILLEGANYHHIKREGRELHWSLWLLVGIALSLDLAADLFGLYSRFPWYDSFLHFLSSGIVCAAFFFAASSF